MRLPTEQRFMGHVDITGYEPDDCWLWKSALIGKGYGQFSWAHAGRRTWQAHLVAYKLFVGEVPAGLELDHLCRNRACVRPSHLEAVTHTENIRRSCRERWVAGECRNGHSLVDLGSYRDPRGKVRCMECARLSRRRYYAKQTEVAS